MTALLRKPLQRERPNERFLRGTLRSVAFGANSPSACFRSLVCRQDTRRLRKTARLNVHGSLI